MRKRSKDDEFEYSVEEIADELNLTPFLVRESLKSGLKKLEVLLHDID